MYQVTQEVEQSFFLEVFKQGLDVHASEML